jgi:hypothetical protein
MFRSLISSLVAIVLVVVPSIAAEAQSTPCPVATEAVVGVALGGPVRANSQSKSIAGFDLCDFIDRTGTDFGVSREQNAFGPGDGGAAALVTRYIPALPDVALEQIDQLSRAGFNVNVPGYEISAVAALGDAAILVKTELQPGFFKDSLIVQLGSDGFSFDTDDSPAAPMQLNALAQAVLANLAP